MTTASIMTCNMIMYENKHIFK